jgi:hypothetical protein
MIKVLLAIFVGLFRARPVATAAIEAVDPPADAVSKGEGEISPVAAEHRT